MRVHDCRDIRPQVINQKMHANFAGHRPAPGESVSFEVHHDHIRRSHGSLAHARGCDQNSPVVQPDRQISVHRRNEATLVQHAPEANDFFPRFAISGHGEFGRSGENKPQYSLRILQHCAPRDNPIYS